MTNDEIRARMDRIANGGELTQAEQEETLRALLRAHKKIMAARKAGFDPDSAFVPAALEDWDHPGY